MNLTTQAITLSSLVHLEHRSTSTTSWNFTSSLASLHVSSIGTYRVGRWSSGSSKNNRPVYYTPSFSRSLLRHFVKISAIFCFVELQYFTDPERNKLFVLVLVRSDSAPHLRESVYRTHRSLSVNVPQSSFGSSEHQERPPSTPAAGWIAVSTVPL